MFKKGGNKPGGGDGAGTLEIVSISAFENFSCALTGTGAAYCWGNNSSGQLGMGGRTKGNRAKKATPQAVAGGFTFAALSVGDSYLHACGVTALGDSYCWGGNRSGELGDGSFDQSSGPVEVSGSHSFRSLTTNWENTCGVTTSSAGYCWGGNSAGDLGNGTIGGDEPAPGPVVGGLVFDVVSTGTIHTCGVTTTEEAYCWGWNSDGQLGVPTAQTTEMCFNDPWCSSVPVQVSEPASGPVNWADIGAVDAHSCGLTTDGAVYCWGSGSTGFLGNGSETSSDVPIKVRGRHIFVSLSMGEQHTCALKAGGDIYCWGYNNYGQLGAETSDAIPSQHCYRGNPWTVPCSNKPLRVATDLSFAAVDGGGSHTCGELGDGSTRNSTVPVRVADQKDPS